MKWASGMNSPPSASAQNIPAPVSARSTRWPGVCSMTVAVAGRGVAPKAVIDTAICCSLIDAILPPRAGGPPQEQRGGGRERGPDRPVLQLADDGAQPLESLAQPEPQGVAGADGERDV